jgi:hypothetical protein
MCPIPSIHSIIHIQVIGKLIFYIMIFAPLSMVLLIHPIRYINEKIMHKRYYNIVRRQYTDPEKVSVEQLKDIFPGKKWEDLYRITCYLENKNLHKDS